MEISYLIFHPVHTPSLYRLVAIPLSLPNNITVIWPDVRLKTIPAVYVYIFEGVLVALPGTIITEKYFVADNAPDKTLVPSRKFIISTAFISEVFTLLLFKSEILFL